MGKETPIITDKLVDLAGCDVIIETVIEDLASSVTLTTVPVSTSFFWQITSFYFLN